MKSLIVAAALLAAATAAAHDVNHAAMQGVDQIDVVTLESVEGEGKTAFVKRAAVELEAFTARTGHEACGWIAYGGAAAFSVRVVTNGSQIACGVAKATVAPGYSAGNETIHSHPQARMLTLTALDLRLRGTKVGNRRESVNPCQFSSTDYQTPGYLVTCGKVMHQNGHGTAKEI